jgi:hypothetical protein
MEQQPLLGEVLNRIIQTVGDVTEMVKSWSTLR